MRRLRNRESRSGVSYIRSCAKIAFHNTLTHTVLSFSYLELTAPNFCATPGVSQESPLQLRNVYNTHYSLPGYTHQSLPSIRSKLYHLRKAFSVDNYTEQSLPL